MAKRRMCEDKAGRASGSEVRLAGWGSSLLNESTSSSPHVSAGAVAAETSPEQAPRQSQWREMVAQVMSRNDRRKNPRLAQPAEIRIQQLSPNSSKAEGSVLGEVQNLSRGGMCIASPVPLVTSSVVQCQIGVPDLKFSIPTLMQVLWVEETGAAEYAAGLRYLF